MYPWCLTVIFTHNYAICESLTSTIFQYLMLIKFISKCIGIDCIFGYYKMCRGQISIQISVVKACKPILIYYCVIESF